MPRIAWTSVMSVGVPEIDRQHQRLIDLFNGLEEGLARGATPRIVQTVFDELVSYSKYHFNCEAHALAALEGYQGLAEHLDAHKDFTEKVLRIEPLVFRHGDESAALAASRFLRSWTVSHILVADRLAFKRSAARRAAGEPAGLLGEGLVA
jgi:hemerythrin